PAKFVCALTLIDKEIIFEAKGTVEGFIAAEPCGKAGFGYDPIFYFPPLAGTFAELSPEQKIAVSHRGQAFRQLRAFLATWQHETHPR
ncbi:MAG: non-canonical purine NTP pyrophosphatase, partial [Acidobacteriota bacterium]|nr:non-canonical purine NTP pyrophosphatase [Acidobacteriota bacterium]